MKDLAHDLKSYRTKEKKEEGRTVVATQSPNRLLLKENVCFQSGDSLNYLIMLLTTV